MEVIVGEKEPLDRALKRFRRMVVRSGLFHELRERAAFEKPSVKRKKKSKEARRRARRAARRADDWVLS